MCFFFADSVLVLRIPVEGWSRVSKTECRFVAAKGGSQRSLDAEVCTHLQRTNFLNVELLGHGCA